MSNAHDRIRGEKVWILNTQTPRDQRESKLEKASSAFPNGRFSAFCCVLKALQNASLFARIGICIACFTNLDSAFGQAWTKTDAPTDGTEAALVSIAMSSDGTELLAAAWYDFPICTSTNFGLSWSEGPSTSELWAAVASSADGLRFVAVAAQTDLIAKEGWIYTSTNVGSTWLQTMAPQSPWYGVACSTNGAVIVASTSDGFIWVSNDSGISWRQTLACPYDWTAPACAASGAMLAAAAYEGPIYISTNGGTSWSPSSATNYWNAIACSADGTTLVATTSESEGEIPDDGGSPGYIFASTNAGLTWRQTGAPLASWSTIATSANGTCLVAGTDGNGIYTSYDSGATWILNDAPAGVAWVSVASSGDGTKLVAASAMNGIYSFQAQPVPVLQISEINVGYLLSWTDLDAGFQLQQNSTLGSTNWVNFPIAPTITNYQYQVEVPPAIDGRFYRLVKP